MLYTYMMIFCLYNNRANVCRVLITRHVYLSHRSSYKWNVLDFSSCSIVLKYYFMWALKCWNSLLSFLNRQQCYTASRLWEDWQHLSLIKYFTRTWWMFNTQWRQLQRLLVLIFIYAQMCACISLVYRFQKMHRFHYSVMMIVKWFLDKVN